ncbi:MAG: hypothetical protein Q9169_006626 [Polycauliona sp. 2 TL-2023]
MHAHEEPSAGLGWIAETIFGGISSILTRHDPKRPKGILKKVRFEVPKDDDEVSVTHEKSNGSSTQSHLSASDARKNYENHGRHWHTAQKIGAESFEEYWHFLSGGNLDAVSEVTPTMVDWKGLFDDQGILDGILVSFYKAYNHNPRQEFKSMFLEVVEARD